MVNYVALCGGNAENAGRRFYMSAQDRSQNSGKKSVVYSNDLTEEQALMLILMGVEALASVGKAEIFNTKSGHLYIRIDNTRAVRDKDGNVILVALERRDESKA